MPSHSPHLINSRAPLPFSTHSSPVQPLSLSVSLSLCYLVEREIKPWELSTGPFFDLLLFLSVSFTMETSSPTKNNNNNNNVVSSLEVTSQVGGPSPIRKMVAVASIAAGIQFGWALQLSLLTPYVQTLGVPHVWAAFIWLCGPISGLLVQPIVGYYSDHCNSRFGRRRPFILSGAIAVAVAVFLIGYAADLGHSLGDDITQKTRPRAVGFFVVGFWILDVANNMLQGPCRAFLADLAAGDHRKMRTANGFFSFFMAVGNILGYAAGSYSKLHKIFPFTETDACNVFCANLKSCFFFSILLLLSLSIFALIYVEDSPVTKPVVDDEDGHVQITCFGQIYTALRELKKPMWMLMIVTAINWIGWFPFFLFDTDWMGREVYGGDAGEKAYDKGVRVGALGLMLQAVVLGFMSLAVEPLGKMIGGVKRLWGIVNFILCIGMAMTVVITKVAEHDRHVSGGATVGDPSDGVKAGALLFFAVLGIPLAVIIIYF